MYPRNAASPPRIAIGAVVQISDGAVQGSGVSVVVRAEGGSETTGGGTISYGASSNIVYYVPTQAETNYTAFVVTAYKTACIPVSVTVVTTASATAGQVVPEDGSITAAKIAADAITDAKVASDVTIASVTGAVGSVTGAVGSVTGNVGGNVVGSVGSVTGHTPQTGDAFARIGATGSGLTSLASATNLATVAGYLDTEIAAILAVTNKLDTALESDGSSGWQYTALALVNGPSGSGGGGLDAAGVRAAIGLASANLDTQLAALPTAAENADAVWDEAMSGHAVSGSYGASVLTIGVSYKHAGPAGTNTAIITKA